MRTFSIQTVILVGIESEDLVLRLRVNSIPASQCHFAAVAEELVSLNGRKAIFISDLPAAVETTEEKSVLALIEQVEAFLRVRRTI
jgi:hypothetical protein